MEGSVVTMQEILKFQRISTDENGNITGKFVATGIRPKFMEEFETRGVQIAHNTFDPNRSMG